MEVDFQEATSLLQKYKEKLNVIPCLEPQYALIDSKRESALTPVFFTYEDEDGFFYHAFHKAKIPKTNYYDIQSSYGYGGPIATSNGAEFLGRAWKEYQSYCEKNDVVAEFIRFHPLLENWQYYCGDVVDNRNTVWIDLNVDDLIASYKENRVRTAVRKAIKNNVAVEFYMPSDFLPVFKKLYYASMDRLQTNSFYSFNSEYLNELCHWEKAWLAVATYNGNITSVLVSLVAGDVLELHLFGSNEESKKSCATNLIYHETFLRAKREGVRKVHFGGSTNDDPKDPLLFFKLGYSNKMAKYKIGKFIHNVEVYESLKKQHEGSSDRILFYR